ncbi:MAG: hypothetical protein GF370_00855 [Candidatus Nealsonbacteria bacterium]|nr:hypothetical protein [Candidatus Nealsonbacteria bacterium]
MVKITPKAKQVLALLERLGKQYGLPGGLVEDAKDLFLELRNYGLTQPMFGYGAASFYYVISRDPECRIIIPLEEFLEKCIDLWVEIRASGWKESIRRRYRRIVQKKGEPIQKCYLSPIYWVKRIGDQMELDKFLLELAVDLAKDYFRSPEKPARTPRTVAGVSLYFISQLMGVELTQEDIAGALDISSAAIRSANDDFFVETTKSFLQKNRIKNVMTWRKVEIIERAIDKTLNAKNSREGYKFSSVLYDEGSRVVPPVITKMEKELGKANREGFMWLAKTVSEIGNVTHAEKIAELLSHKEIMETRGATRNLLINFLEQNPTPEAVKKIRDFVERNPEYANLFENVV